MIPLSELSDEQIEQLKVAAAGEDGCGNRLARVATQGDDALRKIFTPQQKLFAIKREATHFVRTKFGQVGLSDEQWKRIDAAVVDMAKSAELEVGRLGESEASRDGQRGYDQGTE